MQIIEYLKGMEIRNVSTTAFTTWINWEEWHPLGTSSEGSAKASRIQRESSVITDIRPSVHISLVQG